VSQWTVFEVGDDLFDDRVVTMGGLGLEHRLGASGEHSVMAVTAKSSLWAVVYRRWTRRTISRA
jgi:hypothetical protein